MCYQFPYATNGFIYSYIQSSVQGIHSIHVPSACCFYSAEWVGGYYMATCLISVSTYLRCLLLNFHTSGTTPFDHITLIRVLNLVRLELE